MLDLSQFDKKPIWDSDGRKLVTECRRLQESNAEMMKWFKEGQETHTKQLAKIKLLQENNRELCEFLKGQISLYVLDKCDRLKLGELIAKNQAV